MYQPYMDPYGMFVNPIYPLWQFFAARWLENSPMHIPALQKKTHIKITVDSPATPWKINGWNLQITHLERKMI